MSYVRGMSHASRVLLAAVFVWASGCGGPPVNTKVEDEPVVAETPERGVSASWPRWRGTLQSGVAEDRGLSEELSPDNVLWTLDLSGRGTPVAWEGSLYVLGYRGEGPDLVKVLACLDAETGILR
jgi:hypothetical protein